MIGIAGCSIYIPRHRLPREVIAQAWGGRALPGSKAVGNFDEDALTMGHAAVSQLGGAAPDRLYFASTTSPYWQRSAASQIAAACDWGPETGTADFGGSLRSGFSALLAGFDALASGSAREVIVAAADRRDATPESAEESAFGDAAAAVR
ncbi:MAG: 3-hydroxy-3-methylglutaryl CoA synthase, partial [Bryobacteraceae bacterium]